MQMSGIKCDGLRKNSNRIYKKKRVINEWNKLRWINRKKLPWQQHQ